MGFAMRRADDPNFVWNRELLVTFQDRVLAGKFPLGAGRLRTGAAFIVERTTGRQVFAPPQPEELASLVDQACERMREGHPHPAMAAAWIHVAIAGIHPFRDGNGRAARVSATLGMVRGGFKLPEFTSLEEWWGRHLPDYYGAFDAEVDVTPFIEAHMSAQLHQVRALDLREQIERRIWLALEELVERAHLPGRVTNAAWDAFFERDVTSRYYRPLADVGPATAAADLSGAVAAGLLRPIGAGRSRRYGPGEELFRRVGAELNVEVDDLGETARSTIGVVVAARVASERAGPISPRDP
jgi:Fic family protein